MWHTNSTRLMTGACMSVAAALVAACGSGSSSSGSTSNQASAPGITATSVGVDPNATDYVGPLQAANVASVGAISPNGDTTACIEIAKALQQLNVPGTRVISSPLCLAPAVKTALGDCASPAIGAASIITGTSD